MLPLPEARALRLGKGVKLGLTVGLRERVGLRVSEGEAEKLGVELAQAEKEALRLGCERLGLPVGLRETVGLRDCDGVVVRVLLPEMLGAPPAAGVEEPIGDAVPCESPGRET